jgi:hypothetical protein
MSRPRSRLVPVLLAAVLLVGAANLGAFAATGGPLLLGKSNTASKTTTLKSTGNKAALSLKAKSGQPPLQVNSATKVTNLNADLVDGVEPADLRTTSYVYNLTAIAVPTAFVSFALPGLPPGKYHVSYSVAGAVAGGGTFFTCMVATGTVPSLTLPLVGSSLEGGGGNWYSSGGGYVDTTTATHRFACQRGGGSSMTIPFNSAQTARVVFTRVDDAVVAAVTGTSGSAP